jgi:hypothetical protein
MVLELQPSQTFLAENRIGDIGREGGLAAAVGTPNEQDPCARPLGPERAEARLDLIG